MAISRPSSLSVSRPVFHAKVFSPSTHTCPSDVLLQKDVLKGKITSEEKDETIGRITRSDIADFKDVDFAIEVNDPSRL